MRTIFRASAGRQTSFSGRFRSQPLPDSAESSRNDGPITIGFRNHRGRKPRPQRLSEESGIPRAEVKGRVRKTSPAVSLQSMLFPLDSAVVPGFDGRCLPVPDALALCSSESAVVQPKPLAVAALLLFRLHRGEKPVGWSMGRAEIEAAIDRPLLSIAATAGAKKEGPTTVRLNPKEPQESSVESDKLTQMLTIPM